MSYQCPICHRTIEHDTKRYIQHTEEHIVELIKKDHPEWISGDGGCPPCLDFYRQQIKGDKAEQKGTD